MEKEIRNFDLEIRQSAAGKVNQKIIGVASCYNSRSEVLKTKSGQEFREEVAPGAFRNVIADGDCVALINHNPDKILGRNQRTMTLTDGEGGLEFSVDPPDTTYARDLKVSMGRGDIKHCSFGFRVADGGDSWKRDSETGMPIRTIRTIDKLFDVSVVTHPAYDSTECSLRSIGKIEGDAEIPINGTDMRRRRLEIEAVL